VQPSTSKQRKSFNGVGTSEPAEMRLEMLPQGKRFRPINEGHNKSLHLQLPSKNQLQYRKFPVSDPAVNIVRKDEVQAALNSKPQRGKKRENLSALERLELTRTRNREHAKSTRLRKKARYQELLDKEEQLRTLKQEDRLRNDRRKGVVEFMELKSKAIKTRCQDVPADEDLGNLIESLVSFKLVLIENTGTEMRRTHSIGTSALTEIDRVVASSVISNFGESALPLLRLQVGGEEGIGLTTDGAFAQYHIFVEHPYSEDGSTVVEGFIRVSFARESHLMTSIELWSTYITPSEARSPLRHSTVVPFVSSDSLAVQGSSGCVENDACIDGKSSKSITHPFEV